ncbi:MAG: hypothetical protein ACOZDD_08125 [Bacteroidota bacterium]
MKKLLTIILSLPVLAALGQEPDPSMTDRLIKDRALTEIQESLERKTKTIDSTVTALDMRLNSLDQAIVTSRDVQDKAEKLVERIQALEMRQSAMEENEQTIFQANYQSAIVNLVYMDREIKPLILFNTTQGLFSMLSEIGNPMKYPEYKEWFSGFSTYVEREKSREPTLNVLSNLLTLTGDLSRGAPLAGPLTQTMFSGINMYINSMGKGRTDLRNQAERMYIITAKLGQFTHDKNLIEHEWENITKELKEMQALFDSVLINNLAMLKLNRNEFHRNFSNEYDANKRIRYLASLSDIAARKVSDEINSNPKEWKEVIYYQMMDIQALKVSFGRLTMRISENISRYSSLIGKYKNDPDIGKNVMAMESKLQELMNTFESTFSPLEYISAATRMYKVN